MAVTVETKGERNGGRTTGHWSRDESSTVCVAQIWWIGIAYHQLIWGMMVVSWYDWIWAHTCAYYKQTSSQMVCPGPFWYGCRTGHIFPKCSRPNKNLMELYWLYHVSSWLYVQVPQHLYFKSVTWHKISKSADLFNFHSVRELRTMKFANLPFSAKNPC